MGPPVMERIAPASCTEGNAFDRLWLKSLAKAKTQVNGADPRGLSVATRIAPPVTQASRSLTISQCKTCNGK